MTTLAPLPAEGRLPALALAGNRVPEGRAGDFRLALMATRRALYSPRFEELVQGFIADSLRQGAHVAAWQGWTTQRIVQSMQAELPHLSVQTYGGPRGWVLYQFTGNMAYDGDSAGPVLVNRVPLRDRCLSDLINTLGHELAHRVGMTHPNSDRRYGVALKEPPYVIGDILEFVAVEHLEQTEDREPVESARPAKRKPPKPLKPRGAPRKRR